MTKYVRREPKLAVFFLRSFLQMRISKEKIRLILMLNWDQLNWGSVIAEKDDGGIRKK